MSDGFGTPLAVDAICLRNNLAEVLLIRRGRMPWKGKLAFPGGFVDYGENPETAALREPERSVGLTAETHSCTRSGRPDRDPRKRIVSVFYIVGVDEDASQSLVMTPLKQSGLADSLVAEEVAGDHFEVIEQLQVAPLYAPPLANP